MKINVDKHSPRCICDCFDRIVVQLVLDIETKMTKRKAVYNPAADARWRENNKERVNYMRARRGAKSFILTKATEEDLQEIENFVEERKKILQEEEKKL